MAFKSVENDGDLMREGEYEVYVKHCEETETKGGTPCIAFDFVVRSDVEQAYKNKHKFKNFYRDRETGQWPSEKIGKYANALGIPKGDDFELDDLVGRSCVMVIGHYEDKKTLETKDCIYYLKASKAEPYIAGLSASGYGGFAELEDDDGELPF